jgi:serine phosphatase RsbU (regulator of sigma subunit)
MYGKQRLFAVLRRHESRSAAAIAAAILDDVRAFKGAVEFEDDATLVVLKPVSEPPAASSSSPTPAATGLS